MQAACEEVNKKHLRSSQEAPWCQITRAMGCGSCQSFPQALKETLQMAQHSTRALDAPIVLSDGIMCRFSCFSNQLVHQTYCTWVKM